MNQEEFTTKAEELLLDNGYDGIKYLVDFSYDDALIGVTDEGRAVYDYQKMIGWIVRTQGWTEEEAAEWIDYNTVRSLPYMGEGAPTVMYPLI